MQFDIDVDDGSIYMQGETTIELPEHFIILPLAVVRESKGNKNIIIACGRKTVDGDIDLMTGDGRLMTLSSQEHPVPKGKGVPIDGGKAIAFTESVPVKLIDSSSIISLSKTVANA